MYPYNQQLSQLMLQQAIPQATKQEVIKVNGKNGANAFQLAPDSSALLLDTSAPLVWLVQTDGAGYKTLIAYDIKPHEEVEETNAIKALEERIKKLEETVNAKSNTANVKRKSEPAE